MEYKDHPFYPLYLNYARRSLLGGGKGLYVMEQLKFDDPSFYSYVMAEARKTTTVPTDSSERIKELTNLVKSNLTNMVDLTNEI